MTVKEKCVWGLTVTTLVFLTMIAPHVGAPLVVVFVSVYFIRKYKVAMPPIVSKLDIFLKRNALIVWVFLAVLLAAWFYLTGHPAQKVVRKYLKATSIAERLKYVREPEKVLPLMLEYYKGADFSHGTKYYWIRRPVKSGDWTIVRALVPPNGCDYQLKRINGRYKIDWESSVVYNPMTFREMAARTPAYTQKFRVWARLNNNYYYADFRGAERTYYCIELCEANTDECLYGYIMKNSADGQRLCEILRNGDWQAIIIMMGYLPGGSSNEQVLITKFVQQYFNEY